MYVPVHVKIPANVFRALKTAYTSNPKLDGLRVDRYLKTLGYEDESRWVQQNRCQYLLGMRHGFAVEEEE